MQLEDPWALLKVVDMAVWGAKNHLHGNVCYVAGGQGCCCVKFCGMISIAATSRPVVLQTCRDGRIALAQLPEALCACEIF